MIRLCGLVLLCVIVLAPSVAAAQTIDLPVVVDGDGVTVRAERGMERVAKRVARNAPGDLEEIYTDLHGLKRPPRVEIRLVKSNEDIARAAPAGRFAPTWAAGVTYSSAGVVVVAARRGANSINVDSVVAHELAHLALDTAVGDRAPRWLHEGFAYLHSSDWSFARMRTLTGMAWSGDVIPLQELSRRFPIGENAADRAYAESYDFVVFLARRGRHADTGDDGDRWAFREFLAAIADGMDIYSAAIEIYGAPLDELFKEWYSSLRDRYLLVPVGLVSMGIWVFAAILLIIGYVRKRRQNRARLAVWGEQEAAASSAMAATSGKMEAALEAPDDG